jgi:hypothetical protein
VIEGQVPEKVAFLCELHRYKVLYGGRGCIKSWSIAQHLLIAGAERRLGFPALADDAVYNSSSRSQSTS